MSRYPVTRHHQHGQAMAEFVVSVAFVFLPLFVFAPTLGKLIDAQHETQLAARYAAWERTVWFDNLDGPTRDDFKVSGDEWESVALRSEAAVSESVAERFFNSFSNGSIRQIRSVPTGEQGPPEQWKFVQSQKPMVDAVMVSQFEERDTPGIAYAANKLLADGIGLIMTPVQFLLSLVGNDNEDYLSFPLLERPKGFYKPTVETIINGGRAHGNGVSTWDRNDEGNFTPGIESAIFQNWNGVIAVNAGILSDGWSAQSTAFYKERADDRVISDAFDNTLFDIAIDLLSLVEFGPENSAIHKLGFGEVDTNPIPTKDGDLTPIRCRAGICEFQE